MRNSPLIKWRNLIALTALLVGAAVLPLSAAAADLKEILAAQAETHEEPVWDDDWENAPGEDKLDASDGTDRDLPVSSEPAATGTTNGTGQPVEEDGFFNSLSDFLGGAQQGGSGAQTQPQSNDPAEADWEDDAGFGHDEGTYYEGQGLEPEASDMFDDAFGDDTVRATREGPEGPAADDAPEDFTQDNEVETRQLDAPNGGVDIFGRPKGGAKATVENAPDKEEAFKLNLSDLPPVDFEVLDITTVTVRALDKITARMSEHKLRVNTPYNFGTLTIVMRTCGKSPPEEAPEVKAFLQIVDNRPEMENKAWFSGWMFASSPAISALEHPVYDVWVIDCNIVAASADDDNL